MFFSRGIILFLFLVSTLSLVAQVLSPSFKSNNQTNIEGVLLEKDNLMYLVKTEYTAKNVYSVILSAYDTTKLQKKFEKKISVTTKKGFVVKPLEVITLNNKIYFFYSELNTVTGSNLLYANHIGWEGEKIWSREIDTISHTFSSDKNLEIVTDAEESNLMIIRKYAKGFDHPNSINIKYYDQDLNIKWEKNADLPVYQKSLSFKEIVFNHRRLYLHSETEQTKYKDSKIAKSSRTHHIWCYDYQSELLKEFEVALEDREISEINIDLHKDELKVFGTFSYPTKNALNGLFSLIIDGDFEIVQSSLTDFDSGYIHDMVQERDEVSSSKEFYIQELITLENGHSFLFMEKVFKTISDYLDPRTNMYNYTEMYHYNHILIFEFDSNGNFVTAHPIAKKQASRSDNGYFSSFKVFYEENDLWLIYNDNRNNDEADPSSNNDNRALTEYRSLALALLKFDGSNFIKKNYVEEINNYTPKVISGEKFNQFVYLFSEKGNKYQLIKFELPY